MERTMKEAAGGVPPISKELFQRLSREYLPGVPLRLLLSDAEGGLAFSCGDCSCPDSNFPEQRKFAIHSALRWGEPVICDIIPGRLLWAVPVMHNAKLTGGIIACADEERLFPDDGVGLFDLKAAGDRLLELATEFNLCNSALLKQIREEHRLERCRAEAIHEAKAFSSTDILQLYLQEQPPLLQAIRSGRRAEAVGIINRLLVFIYGHAPKNISLIKSLLLELISAMNRTAVEAGARPEEVFTRNFSHLIRLGEIEGEEELSGWVVEVLEELFASLRRCGDDRGALLRQISEILARRCAEQLSREEVAQELDISPSTLSRFLKEQAGCGFSQMLARVRVGQASKLLANTPRPLIQIAYDCGFTDQSYFTRIFHQQTGLTPKEYRLRYSAVKA